LVFLNLVNPKINGKLEITNNTQRNLGIQQVLSRERSPAPEITTFSSISYSYLQYLDQQKSTTRKIHRNFLWVEQSVREKSAYARNS